MIRETNWAAAQVTGANAKTYALKIDPQLTSLKGAQSYDLPAGFAPEKYQSLLIHCWKYNHLYAAATVKLEAASALIRGSASPSRTEGAKNPHTTVLRLSREGGRLWAVEEKGGAADAAGPDAASVKVEPRRFDFTGRSGARPIR